jgi:exonuclease III
MTLAMWNMRTMLQVGKMEEVAREMLNFGIDVIALQEMRRSGYGRIDKKKYSAFYNGSDNSGLHGTGFIINSTMKQKYLGFEPLGDRICKIRFKGNFQNLTIISAYALTEEADEEEKGAFYDKLERECNKIPRYDVTVLLGDFNA